MHAGLRFVLAVVAMLALVGQEPAVAQTTPVCGAPLSAKSTELAKPELSLDGLSKTAISYGRDTDAETLNLVFAVSGCTLTHPVPELTVAVKPKGGSGQLPEDLVTVRDAISEGSTLEVELKVAAADFDPGSYDAYLVMRSPTLLYVRTPISISRSEDNIMIPVLIGAAAGLLGFLWLAATKLVTRDELTMGWKWLLPVSLVAACFGAVAVVSTWWDQDVWTVHENLRASVAAGIAGATTGSMLTLIGALWKGKTPVKQE